MPLGGMCNGSVDLGEGERGTERRGVAPRAG